MQSYIHFVTSGKTAGRGGKIKREIGTAKAKKKIVLKKSVSFFFVVKRPHFVTKQKGRIVYHNKLPPPKKKGGNGASQTLSLSHMLLKRVLWDRCSKKRQLKRKIKKWKMKLSFLCLVT